MKLLPLLLLPVLAASSAQAGVGFPPKVIKAETKLFAKVDKDDNDAISFDEFKALMKALPVAIKKFPIKGRGDDPEELLEICEVLFDFFDATNDNSINLEEWVVQRQAPSLAELAGVVAPLPGFDRNHDETVKLKEFLPLMKSFFPAKTVKAVYKQILAGPSGILGASAAIASIESSSSGVSMSWVRSDPAAAAAWVAAMQAAEANRPVPAVPDDTTPEEEAPGRRTRVIR
ncbi:EF-hand domain-containing protein [Luteolibacter sp. Populi]|uniref:EF-hand domain-containing protein n=1 Tax=Luteolibacter sp. Populi TaxID=3230487 RepID=UPI0034679EF3